MVLDGLHDGDSKVSSASAVMRAALEERNRSRAALPESRTSLKLHQLQDRVDPSSFRLDLLYMWPAGLLSLRLGTRVQKSGSCTHPVPASFRLILGWFCIFVESSRNLRGGWQISTGRPRSGGPVPPGWAVHAHHGLKLVSVHQQRVKTLGEYEGQVGAAERGHDLQQDTFITFIMLEVIIIKH